MALYESVAQTVGNTPLVRIKNFENKVSFAKKGFHSGKYVI